MISFKVILLLSVSLSGLYQISHAASTDESNKNSTSDIKKKETGAIIQLSKGITVSTGLNLDKTPSHLNGTEASYVAKIRKVSKLGIAPEPDNTAAKKTKPEANVKYDKNINQTTIARLPNVTAILTEGGGAVSINAARKNLTGNTTKNNSKNEDAKPASKQDSINETDIISAANTNVEAKGAKNSSTTTTKQSNSPPKSSGATATTAPKLSLETNLNKTDIASANSTSTNINANSKSSLTVSSTTTSTTTTTTTTTTPTTTTTTTTPKPKKPTVTYSVPDFPDLEKDNPELNNLLQSSLNKLPVPDVPYAQPSQEFNSNFHHGRDFILPIVSMIFIIPLVIGILITSYRRFRDCWSTRHYRRMDFLVDGMYND